MYLRRNQRKCRGSTYEYWTLVESVRTLSGPRQRIVATLGKLPGLDEEVRVGWEHIAEVLDGRLHQLMLLSSDPEPPRWATVDVSRARVERLRRFGDVYLGLALWRRLKLDRFFDAVTETGREEVCWGTMACILALARFCAPSSELRTADFWYGKTALDDLLAVSAEKVNDDRLYRALDALLAHKDELFSHFQRTYGELFGTTFDLLLYDVTSTYFEGEAKGNPQAKRGYSRDGRPDCVQVCIGLVVTPEGLPLAYEVFDGNRADVTTVEEIVEVMREKYGQERRTWVMDRGMVSEENLEQLREWNASYLVGTPKSMLKSFEQRLLERDWERIEPGVELKLCAAPDGTDETFVLCRSPGRMEKEKAIRERQFERLEDGLAKLKVRIEAPTRALRDRGKAERRVGRLFQRYTRAARLFTVNIQEVDDPEHKSGKRLTIDIHYNQAQQQWAELADGCYLLRTNLEGCDAHESRRLRRRHTVENLHRPDPSRRQFPHIQTRPGPAAHIPSETRAHPSPHSRLLSSAGHVAHTTTLDAGLRLGYRTPKTTGRDGRGSFTRHRAAHRCRQKHPLTHRRSTRTASRDSTSKTRVSIAKQT